MPDGIELAIKVTPRADRAAVLQPVADASGGIWLAVKVTAAPEQGKATRAALELVASLCGVSGSAVRLVSGMGSRWKRVAVTGRVGEIGRNLASRLPDRTHRPDGH